MDAPSRSLAPHERLNALLADIGRRPAYVAEAARASREDAELFGEPGPPPGPRSAVAMFARLDLSDDDRALALAAWDAVCQVYGPTPAALPDDTCPGDPDWQWWTPGW